MTLYLVRAACPSCGGVASLVEETGSPVPLMHDVPVETRWCPECGEPVGVGGWDVREDAEIERVEPTDPHVRGSARWSR